MARGVANAGGVWGTARAMAGARAICAEAMEAIMVARRAGAAILTPLLRVVMMAMPFLVIWLNGPSLASEWFKSLAALPKMPLMVS